MTNSGTPDSKGDSQPDSQADSQREKFLAALEKKKGKGSTPTKGGGSSGPKISGAQQRGGISRQNVQRKSGGA